MCIPIGLVIQVARQTPRNDYKTGRDGFFTRINKDWGIKLFRDEEMRDKTYNLQSIAYDVDAAPELGNKFELKIPKMGYFYGYVTECVTETPHDVFEKENGPEPDINDSSDEAKLWSNQYYEFERKFINTPEYQDLMRKLERVDITSGDMYIRNVGWLENGTLVAIDFSDEDWGAASDPD